MSQGPSGVRVATLSVTGRRDHNEDRVVAAELDDDRLLVAVADGMGGHAAGEVASHLALETLESSLRDGAGLEEAVKRANREVHAAANAEAGRQGMGTTLVAMLLEPSGYRIANVGDSRAYVLEPSGIRQLSVDHSFVAEAVRRGESEEEAMASRWKDALTRSIGTQDTVEVDLFGPFEATPGSAVMLCSDGLFKVVGDLEMRSLYGTSSDPQQGVEVLVEAADAAGSDDNVTVAVVEFGDFARMKPGETTPLVWSRTESAPVQPAGATANRTEPAGTADTTPAGSPAPAAGGSSMGVVVAVVVVVVLALAAFLLF